MKMKRIIPFMILALVVLQAGSCSMFRISAFDQYVYTQTTSVKVDALNVMGMAGTEFKKHEKEVKDVDLAIAKIYEYERNRKHNEISLQLWDKLRDTTGHLYGGFISRWRKEGTLGAGFIDESKRQAGSAFDIIAQLESRKIKPGQAQN